MSIALRTALLALTASVVISGTAQAGNHGGIKNFSFTAQDSVLGNPLTFVFVPRKGKYHFDRIDGGPIKLRLKGEKIRRARITSYEIYIRKPLAGGKPSAGGKLLASNGSQEGSWKKLDRRLSVGSRQTLKDYEAEALKLCRQHGAPNERVVKSLGVRFYGVMSSKGKNYNVSLDSPATRGGQVEARAKVVCMPEPFNVKDVKLSIKRNGSMTSCPAQITLRAQFKANKAGKFTFRLFRGDGAFRDIDMTANSSGHATYTRKYSFNKTTHRKYLAAVKGGAQASSQWTPMSVNCSQPVGGGALTTAPRPNLD